MSKKRILFVDDDPHVLAGLKNVMHRERARWEAVFVDSGARALTELASATFDVIVCDMRMPEMDGVTLLEQVHEHWPQTGRVILSGSADREDVDRVTAAVDEVLGKPCGSAVLKATLERMMMRSSA